MQFNVGDKVKIPQTKQGVPINFEAKDRDSVDYANESFSYHIVEAVKGGFDYLIVKGVEGVIYKLVAPNCHLAGGDFFDERDLEVYVEKDNLTIKIEKELGL